MESPREALPSFYPLWYMILWLGNRALRCRWVAFQPSCHSAMVRLLDHRNKYRRFRKDFQHIMLLLLQGTQDLGAMSGKHKITLSNVSQELQLQSISPKFCDVLNHVKPRKAMLWFLNPKMACCRTTLDLLAPKKIGIGSLIPYVALSENCRYTLQIAILKEFSRDNDQFIHLNYFGIRDTLFFRKKDKTLKPPMFCS